MHNCLADAVVIFKTVIKTSYKQSIIIIIIRFSSIKRKPSSLSKAIISSSPIASLSFHSLRLNFHSLYSTPTFTFHSFDSQLSQWFLSRSPTSWPSLPPLPPRLLSSFSPAPLWLTTPSAPSPKESRLAASAR